MSTLTVDAMIREAYQPPRERRNRLDQIVLQEALLDRARVLTEDLADRLAHRNTHSVTTLATTIAELAMAYNVIQRRLPELGQ